MADVFFPNVGEVVMLTDALANDNAWSVKLFQNDHTPSDSDTDSDYTEADFGGYSAGSLSKDGGVGTDGAGKAAQDYDPITWTHDGSSSDQDVYGWYIEDSGGTLVCASRFDAAPVTMGTGGTLEINVPITLTLANEV